MKNVGKRKNILFLFFAVLIIFLLFFIIYKTNCSKEDGSLISTKTIQATVNGQKKTYQIEKYEGSDNSTKLELTYQSSLFKKISYQLPGFEDEVFPCKTDNGYLGDDFKDVLCLTGNVGVHSQNIALIRVYNDKFQPIYFQNGAEKLANIVSDVPNIQLKDYNNDGKDELVVDSRDYDSDPTVDSIRNAYVFKNGNLENIKGILY